MSRAGQLIESATENIIRWIGLKSVVFEVIQDCNQDCVFCYNVWKCADYPRGEYDTRRTIELLDRVIHDYRPYVLSLSGGEPLHPPSIEKKRGCEPIMSQSFALPAYRRVGQGVCAVRSSKSKVRVQHRSQCYGMVFEIVEICRGIVPALCG